MHKHCADSPPQSIKVYGDYFCASCDSQARYKVFGTAAPSHHNAFCAWCKCNLRQIDTPEAYLESGECLTHSLSFSCAC